LVLVLEAIACGACDCPRGLTKCQQDVPGAGPICTDTSTDVLNCGSCGNKCALGYEVCRNGNCVKCDILCGPNEVLDRFACRCTCPTTRCGGACCPAGNVSCCGGACCADPSHCTQDGGQCCQNVACGSQCCGAPTDTCCGGVCCPDQAHCTQSGNQCCNGTEVVCGDRCCLQGCCPDGVSCFPNCPANGCDNGYYDCGDGQSCCAIGTTCCGPVCCDRGLECAGSFCLPGGGAPGPRGKGGSPKKKNPHPRSPVTPAATVDH
jgi:hypothetical protein